MTYSRYAVAFCAVLCWPLAASATDAPQGRASVAGDRLPATASAIERLRVFFQGARAIQADFQQTLTDSKGREVQQASGMLVMQRPGKFRWDYKTPYHQVIASDGKEITIYDKDLEQATIKPLSHVLGSTPAALLSGDQPLEENFNITQARPRDGLDWVELTPKQSDSGFERIRLGFNQSDLRAMEMLDSFGQITELRFTNLTYDAAPDPSRFVFTPPVGTDILRESAPENSPAHQK